MAISQFFELREIKDCRKYRKHIYCLPQVLDASFIAHFSFLGSPKITPFRQFVADAHDLLTIRSDTFGIELAGGLSGNDLFVTFGSKDQSLVDFLEDELRQWVTQSRTN